MTGKWVEWRGSLKAWPVLLLTFCLGSVEALATEIPPAFDQALVALESNDCPAALEAFQALPHPPPEAIRPRVNFLTGYCLLQLDRPVDALPLLEQAATEYDLLADYAMSYAAQAALALEDRDKAITMLSSLVALYPNSRVAEEASFRLAMTHLEMEQHGNAEKALRDFLHRYPGSSLAPEASLLLAKHFLALDRDREATPILKRLYIRFPTDPTAAEAERLLEETQLLTTITPEERLLRTRALYRKGKYREAAAALTPLLESDPENGEIRLLLARSLFAKKEYPQTIVTLLPLTGPTVPSRLQVKALFLMGRASLRSREYFQAIAYLDRILALFPRSRLADDALHLIGLSQEERGEEDVALGVYARLLRLYPNGGLGDTARWRRAWLLYRQRKLQPATEELKRLLQDYPQSPQRAQALYWRGRLLEAIGKHSPAKKIYRRLLKEATLDPYYEWRARERLRLKPERFSPRRPAPSKRRSSLAQARARELFYLRIWAEAAAEYWDLATVHPHEIALQWEACQALFRANEFDKMITVARRAFFTLIKTGRRREAINTFWSFLYPRGFWPWVDQYVKETSLDPYLVTALIREESAFAPTAISQAGARGLMQLMPTTAARVAHETGLQNPVDLDSPGPNIALGTRYLTKLHGEFGGDLVLTLAAYNAGPGAVRRWIKDHHPIQDHETFIEEIPYRETRRYVKRVLGSYDRYRTLYAGPK